MNVIKILTIVISMLFVITLLDLILVHVILDTLAMGFHALVSISHNRFETEVDKYREIHYNIGQQKMAVNRLNPV